MLKKVSALLALSFALAGGAFAGHEITQVDDKSKVEVAPPCRTWFPDRPLGFVTFGTESSKHLTGGYIDSITGLWAPCDRDAFLFLDSRYHYEDNGQFISSTGLGFRKLFKEHDVIVGVNVFRDSIHSERENDFDQLGLGAEILTKWVDARFNYYLPEDDQYVVDRSSRRDFDRTIGVGPGGAALVDVTRRRTYKQFEAALEGFNTEIGFLIPGLDQVAEVRLFGGYHHYNNPFGKDFEGFQARLEARVLPGVIADLQYWDDTALMGGHWTAGVRVSVPFSIYNLVTGRNPFEGIGEQFTFRKREFGERMGEMVERSHRIQTVTSGRELVSDRTTTTTRLLGPGGVPLPPLGVPLE